MTGMNEPVLIAGGGIGGLATALTLHQIGVPCLVFEAVPHLESLGVGINLQPNAVRELYDLGLEDGELQQIGVRCREWALVGLNGNDIYSEPRGLEAGYNWPQYSVHRGDFHMLLYRTAVARLGEGCFFAGHRVTGYRNRRAGVTIEVETSGNTQLEFDGSLLVAADGIHSAARAQMHPRQPPIHWGGAIMWRGISPGVPIRTGASFVGLGTHRHRIVFYPISPPDPETGLATINWIAEITVDNADGWSKGDWSKKVALDDFLHHFEGWDYGWLNVPELLSAADDVFEFPMIDRDPVATWRDGNVVLLGDAAHPMFPTGSNGAAQAVVDARVLGACMLEQGVTPAALEDYDRRLCREISGVVLRNRGAGPFGILNIVEERCGSVFENIDDVMSKKEMDEFMRRYLQAAGYAMEALNSAPPIIAPGSRVNAG
ncbi:MAG: flavin-dependent oxidoreductase [Gammaproteobacteria bacterium]|nr:flavin-dependent oxidoreductase [Gammaproteobacteria bacterium]